MKCHHAMMSIYTDIHRISVFYNILQHSECIDEKCQLELYSKYDKKHDFHVILG